MSEFLKVWEGVKSKMPKSEIETLREELAIKDQIIEVLAAAVKHYSNDDDHRTYLDVFDCIERVNSSVIEFDHVKFSEVANAAQKRVEEIRKGAR